MTGLPSLYTASTLLAATLAMIAVWAPRRLWVKLAAVGVTFAFVPVGYAGLAELLSRPKPVELTAAARSLNEAEVLGAQLREPEAIFLWVQPAGIAEPRYYRLPWSKEAAQQLQNASQQAERQGTGVVVRLPYESSHTETERMFHARPQQKLPEKAGATATPGAIDFRRPG